MAVIVELWRNWRKSFRKTNKQTNNEIHNCNTCDKHFDGTIYYVKTYCRWITTTWDSTSKPHADLPTVDIHIEVSYWSRFWSCSWSFAWNITEKVNYIKSKTFIKKLKFIGGVSLRFEILHIIPSGGRVGEVVFPGKRSVVGMQKESNQFRSFSSI